MTTCNNNSRETDQILTSIYKTVITALCFSLCLHSFAQELPKRPKIGVTLSGGGAKGLAHIGILEAMDSAGLKVDYITGTSMGSVVGGLYAAGYSADTIEAVARELDWDILFSKAPQITSVSIEEKHEFNKYAVEIPFYQGRFRLSKGFIEGQELWLKLAELFQPVYKITDFNQLSIPFACVGTDLATGNAVVMDQGNIIDCIRASMAIPAVFTPVVYNDKTLVDGGITNNFPVLEVKKMGADIVIGVNLNKGLLKAEELKTSLDILMQMAFFKDAADFEKNREQCDIYITPDLQGNSAGSFDNSDSILDIGKNYGQLYYPIFKRLADSLNALYPPSVPFVKDRLPKSDSMLITKYTVTGLDQTTQDFFFELSGLHAGKAYSYKKVAESIRRIYGSRYYNSIKYDFVELDSGQTEMRFRAKENPLTMTKVALNYNGYTKLSLIGNITSRDLIFKESRALATLSLSENPRVLLQYYKYLSSNPRWGLDFSWYNEHVDFPVYQDFELFETLRSNYSLYNIRTQYNINRASYVGLNQQYNRSVIKTPESPAVIFDGKNQFWHTYLNYAFNNTDYKYFTTKGWKIKGEIGFVYSQDGHATIKQDDVVYNADSLGFTFKNLARISLRAEHFVPLNKKVVLLGQTSFAFMSTENPYTATVFQVGGIADNALNQVQFAGLNESEIKTGSIVTGQLGLQWKVFGSVYITGRVNIALYDFYHRSFNELSAPDNFLSGYSLTAGLTTPLGPIEITGMYCDQDGKIRPNLNLGYRF
ncbi:MAG TPA: patatin-like phospholipase family protein [Flavitalea sp.]|nr:patatin-like phospholipase family protein [Flavitalea sp.]